MAEIRDDATPICGNPNIELERGVLFTETWIIGTKDADTGEITAVDISGWCISGGIFADRVTVTMTSTVSGGITGSYVVPFTIETTDTPSDGNVIYSLTAAQVNTVISALEDQANDPQKIKWGHQFNYYIWATPPTGKGRLLTGKVSVTV
jgi:hypothetical protein